MIAVSSGWVSDIQALPYLPDDNTLNWVSKPFVLSQYLRKASQSFQVIKLSQGFDYPNDDEVESYPDVFESTEKAFVRQVLLCDGQKPLTYGRILAPMSTYQALSEKIESLAGEPFGEKVIYSHPDYKRSEFEYQHLTGFDIYPSLFRHLGESYRYHEAWGRRSMFSLGGNPLAVIEVFMPNLPPFPV